MLRLRRNKIAFKNILILLAIPLALSSTGYAIFSQQLSVIGDSANVAYYSTQHLDLTYTKSVSASGSDWVYTMSPMTVKNNGTLATLTWQVKFDIPTGATQFSCTNANCTQSGVTVTAVNTGTNGSIAAGSSTNFSCTFKTNISNYSLQNIYVSGTLVLVYQTMAGLTMGRSIGTRTKSGKWYYWPYTITVYNSSGYAIRGWRITASWSSTTNVVSSMASTVNYTTSATQLTITSKTGMNNGTTFPFAATLGSTNMNWTLSGYAVQGAL